MARPVLLAIGSGILAFEIFALARLLRTRAGVSKAERRATGHVSTVSPQTHRLKDTGDMHVFGHRGASAHRPENTLSAVRHALELGAHGVEVDVQLSKDHKVFVLHDTTLERTAQWEGSKHPAAVGAGPHLKDILTTHVGSLDYSEIKDVNVGSAEYPEAAPLLLDVLEYLFSFNDMHARAARRRILVEVKADNHEILEPLVQLIVEARDQMRNSFHAPDIAFISFDVPLIKRLAGLLPDHEHYAIFDEKDTDVEKVEICKGLSGIDLEVSTKVSSQLVHRAKESGLKTITWVSRRKGTDGPQVHNAFP